MVTHLKNLLNSLDQRKHQILLVAQTALPRSQFEAYRKIVLNELGKSGFQKELEDAFSRIKER